MVLKGEEGRGSEESAFSSGIRPPSRCLLLSPCPGEEGLDPASDCISSSACVLLISSCDVVKSIGIVLRGLKWLVMVFLLAVLWCLYCSFVVVVG